MASVPNQAYPWAKSSHVVANKVTVTNIAGTYISGSQASVEASTYSGSALYQKGVRILEGFKVTGSVAAGDVLVVSSDSNDYLSGSKQAFPTTVVGVAAAAAANDAAVQVIVDGVVTLYASGSITRGTTVGSAGLSGSGYVATSATAGTVVGKALNSAATNAAVRVLLGLW